MAIFAHPDDEQLVSGTFAKYAASGVETTLVIATRGEEGEIAPGIDANADTLGAIREKEMQCATAKLGIQHLHFLDYRDSGMAGTAANNDPRCLHCADLLAVSAKLVGLIRQYKPQVILTFDPTGVYSHPDHLSVHRAALMAFFLAGDPNAFPDQFQTGLAPWTPLKLYYPVWRRVWIQLFVTFLRLIGQPTPEFLKTLLDNTPPNSAITTQLDVSNYVGIKRDALLCHASQSGPDAPVHQTPKPVWDYVMRTETFVRAYSLVASTQSERDLFIGI